MSVHSSRRSAGRHLRRLRVEWLESRSLMAADFGDFFQSHPCDDQGISSDSDEDFRAVGFDTGSSDSDVRGTDRKNKRGNHPSDGAGEPSFDPGLLNDFSFGDPPASRPSNPPSINQPIQTDGGSTSLGGNSIGGGLVSGAPDSTIAPVASNQASTNPLSSSSPPSNLSTISQGDGTTSNARPGDRGGSAGSASGPGSSSIASASSALAPFIANVSAPVVAFAPLSSNDGGNTNGGDLASSLTSQSRLQTTSASEAGAARDPSTDGYAIDLWDATHAEWNSNATAFSDGAIRLISSRMASAEWSGRTVENHDELIDRASLDWMQQDESSADSYRASAEEVSRRLRATLAERMLWQDESGMILLLPRDTASSSAEPFMVPADVELAAVRSLPMAADFGIYQIFERGESSIHAQPYTLIGAVDLSSDAGESDDSESGLSQRLLALVSLARSPMLFSPIILLSGVGWWMSHRRNAWRRELGLTKHPRAS